MMHKNKLMAIIEGLLFLYGDEGIALTDLENVLENEKPSEIKGAIKALEEKYYEDESSAFSIQKFSTNKYRLQTKTTLHEWFAKLEDINIQTKLSMSAIEVLSIVAYKGPISKAEIDNIRGVDSTYQIYKLKDRHLIRSVGKTEGTRANLYAITENFFKLFNLNGGKELLPQISDDELAHEVEVKKEHHKSSGSSIFATDDDNQNMEELFGDH
ncbi:SMC-Scp complex subunit ScpB [Williamsoniiplasma lucivorax]|uniref:Chromosome condensation and segregation factor B n=1 Tax=Williamsoniiplasma lucivorax TaxID=209274 RepID=A0A2S5RD93_9MOLU|nr:SMC-Scp complex subunit ScpB [Williamsoniiplasma lucivorax]PPE05280.1 chromosome condensation and segregation factor B [Williamsoniiplasma lucivorax]